MDAERIIQLEKENAELRSILNTFHFILPEYHVNQVDCITNTELYRVQYKLAKQMYKTYINKKLK